MAVVTMKQLLEAGVHFGHQTRRWNPKMKRFIFTERNGIYIIDLQQTLSYIDRAYEFVRETVAHGGTILFVGTKKQAQEAIADAGGPGQHAVRQPALAGRHAHQLPDRAQAPPAAEGARGDGADGGLRGSHQEGGPACSPARRTKLEKTLGGIRDMAKVPSAVWIVDTKKEHIAVGEARKLGIPVVAILDTNCDPDEVDYPIPGNDDAIRSAALLTKVIADAVADGLMARSARSGGGDDKPEGVAAGRAARRVGARAARPPARGRSDADARPRPTPAAPVDGAAGRG